MARWGRIIVFLLVLAGVGAAGLHWWRTHNISAVQRGWTVAHENGCFTCHGPGGIRGMLDPGHGLQDVPPWSRDLITMYVENEGEIREWILDGMPGRLRKDPQQMALREKAAILMPAYRGILSERQLRDVVAYVKAASDFERPEDEKAEEGRQVGVKFGCFNCHGPQGRGSMPNVRAFKGYIPSWDGADFVELAKDDAEIREWVLDGITQRFRNNPLARWFLTRQPVKMPAYRGHISDAEVDRLLDYIHWLRKHPYD